MAKNNTNNNRALCREKEVREGNVPHTKVWFFCVFVLRSVDETRTSFTA